MKKRILSLLLALVTVFYIIPFGAFPVIALDGDDEEETTLTLEDLEVGKLYKAEFSSDVFDPYVRFPFISFGDENRDLAYPKITGTEILRVTRKSENDFDLVYLSDSSLTCLGEHTEYRYVDANYLYIGDGISVEDMEIGKEYQATWNTSDQYFNPYRAVADNEADFLQYGYFDNKNSETEIKNFPKDLIIELVYENDWCVRVTNNDWPAEYEQYRYVNPYVDLVITGEVHPPKITYRGEEVTEITLYEDGKMPLKAVKPEELTGNVEWTWEVLVDAANGTWAKIGDKTTDICNVTYALVVNVLDENGQAKLRAVAKDGENEHKSEPITVKMKYIPKPMEPEYDNVTAEETGYTAFSAKSYSANGKLIDNPGVMSNDSTAMVTITVEFIKVRPDGTRVEGSHHDKRTLRTDYVGYTVELPSVLGYYPSMIAPSDPYDFKDNPAKDDSLKEITIEAGLTSDKTITVYYYPGTAKYTIYHYKKNVYDDNYTPYGDPTTSYGVIDKPIDDCHLVGDQIPGFYYLYYDHTEVAADGSTVIEIHYDREYYPVLFELEKKGAHGQENLYVQYETEVGISDPKAPGWTFNFWELIEGNPNPKENLPAGRENKVKITDKVVYKANWEGAETSYTVVYWLENANDGNYSVWYTPDSISATSGGFAEWNKIIPQEVKDKPEYPYVTLNSEKTNAEMYKDSPEGVIIEGDGSTTVNVYFNRRTYNITFQTPSLGTNVTHTHDGVSCEYNPIYCTHVHNASCVNQGHEHDSTCVPTCDLDVHIHVDSCCTAHIHNVNCYSVDADMTTSLTPIVTELIEEDIRKYYSGGGVIGEVIAYVVNASAGKSSSQAATSASAQLSSAEPPKNLQNGYVYILQDIPVGYEGKGDKWYNSWISASGTIYVDVPAIYIDNGNDNPNDDWYYYTGDLGDGEIESVNSNNCQEPDHDHTSGCVYVDSKKCSNVNHNHTADCMKCGNFEHVHNDLCYTGCGAAEGCGQHHHTADCYGNVCSLPTHGTITVKDGDNKVEKDGTIIQLQAKYGQEITEYLPYYLELSDYGLHRNNNANFIGWQYAGTGWKDNGETRYVKHVTMEDVLCYSRGVTATAMYDSTYNTPYLLYYLFESFDQTSGANNYDANGSARQKYNGKWYDADTRHMQLVMWNSANSEITGGTKTTIIDGVVVTNIEGVKYLDKILTAPNGWSVSMGSGANAIQISNMNAYFYSRNTDDIKISVYNQSEKLFDIPKDGLPNPLMYGLPLSQLKQALLASAEYGNFDVNNISYPNTLEAGGYTFAGWYSTPYISEHTRIDWDIATMPNGQLNLYALWKPVTRYVEIYEDATMTPESQFDPENNKGYQEIGFRSFAIEPEYQQSDYYKNNYIFNGWFYKDAITGEETAFLFNFPITQDMKIYAKWISTHSVKYRLNFVLEVKDSEGNVIDYVKVADSIEGTSVAGQNKTFRAAAGDDLYADYHHGFFPKVGSHTLQMVYDESNPDAINEYNFIYEEVEEVPYFVKFVDKATGQEFDSTNPKYPTSYVVYTRQAAVTELFIPIEGYTVDSYSKSLIISTGDPEINNVITFYYEKNEVDEPITPPWIVNYYIQNVDGSYSMFSYTEGKKTEVNKDVYGKVISIDKYEFVDAKVITRYLDPVTSEIIQITYEKNNLKSKTEEGFDYYGYELNAYGLEINLYYNRIKMGYTIIYEDVNTGEQFYKYTVDAENSVPHGHQITVDIDMQKHMYIVLNEGCNLVDPSTQRTWTININPALNVFTFYYEEYKSVYEYHIVCDDPDNGVGLSMTIDSVNAGETDPTKMPVGSMPYESDTHYFAGWFMDEACTIPITSETITSEKYSVTLGKTVEIGGESVYVPNYLTPTKTDFKYESDDEIYEGNLYLEDHYYALFLPRAANVQITVASGQADSFILTFIGTEGTALGETFTVAVHDGVAQVIGNVKIGVYTVTANADWSWRYGNISGELVVAPAASGQIGGTLTLIVTPMKDKWLTDDAAGTVTPTVTP